MNLYRLPRGAAVRSGRTWHAVSDLGWDELINHDDLHALLREAAGRQPMREPETLLAPIGSQEIWAAGVTYYRSRDARMAESREAGGADFYDRVYQAERPELFLKATPHRCVGHGETMHLRRDSKWIVPEPELTLVINARGRIVGFTAGNDLSCRDIEGENPLYLPQAKIFDRCAAVGPGIHVTDEPAGGDITIRCVIERGGKELFAGETSTGNLRKKPQQLVDYLFRDNRFPAGCLLMTGTGIVPPDTFSLRPGDVVKISVDHVGTLRNVMA